jgi:hypothetical protein
MRGLLQSLQCFKLAAGDAVGFGFVRRGQIVQVNDHLVAIADMFAAVDAMKPVGRRTQEFQVAGVCDATDLTGQRGFGKRLDQLAQAVDLGVVENRATVEVQQFTPFGQNEKAAAVMHWPLRTPSGFFFG